MKKKIFWIVGGVLALVVAVVIFARPAEINQQPPNLQVTSQNLSPEERMQVYDYEPLHVRVYIDKKWEEIPTASLVLPQDILGARFAFQKKGTSCVLAYVTAREDALGNYVEITDQMAIAGKITDRQLLDSIYNNNFSDTFDITAWVSQGTLHALNERIKAGEQPALDFHDGGIIFISLAGFKESSRQMPMFVLFDDGSGVPWDGHCLSDMVNVVRYVDSPEGSE